jgi:hypothetical protein
VSGLHLAIGRDARSLRFLALCVGGWTVMRVAAQWSPDVPPPPPEAATPPWSVPSPFAATDWRNDIAPRISHPIADTAPAQRLAGLEQVFTVRSGNVDAAAMAPGEKRLSGDSGGADRHTLRAALIARLFPSPPGGAMRTAMRRSKADWYPVGVPEQAAPGRGRPFWMRRQMAGWSLGGWLYLRGGALAAPEGIAAAGQLGGSQAGLRLAYGLGSTGRSRVYGRATVALRRLEQRELAFGLAFAPVGHWPLDVAIEQRVAVGREGRTALAAMVSGGVGDVALPHGFRLEAYGQAGIVGARRRDGFADGAVVIDRRVGADESSPLRVGALAAGAVQPGAARVDVGPRLTLRLPDVGQGSRIALDWRQRIAGDARPASGLALTLASDF